MRLSEKIYLIVLTAANLILWADTLWYDLFFQEMPYAAVFTLLSVGQFLLFRKLEKIYAQGLLLASFSLLAAACIYHFKILYLTSWGIGFTGAKSPTILPLAIGVNLALTFYSFRHMIFLIIKLSKNQS